MDKPLRYIPIVVTLFDPRTQTRGRYVDRLAVWDEEDDGLFIWQEGNFACDCNRSDFLYVESPHDESCGMNIVMESMIREDTGEEIYREQPLS